MITGSQDHPSIPTRIEPNILQIYIVSHAFPSNFPRPAASPENNAQTRKENHQSIIGPHKQDAQTHSGSQRDSHLHHHLAVTIHNIFTARTLTREPNSSHTKPPNQRWPASHSPNIQKAHKSSRTNVIGSQHQRPIHSRPATLMGNATQTRIPTRSYYHASQQTHTSILRLTKKEKRIKQI